MAEAKMYQTGKVYKIESSHTSQVYIGSTIVQLNARMTNHRSAMVQHSRGEHTYCSSFEVLKYPDAEITLIEDYPCDSKEQLRAREQYWIDNTDCVNSMNAYATPEQLRQRAIERTKEWAKLNREHFNKNANDYYHLNKERVAAAQRKWNAASPTIYCECGGHYKQARKPAHLRTKIHQWFEAQERGL